ncbi:unnamed protein product [Blepharisma stoltei]|uniref:C2H2-type domain-containing protein n=1 Tax=Blepharisma stoltei TaxID=1481888 RepID=A0AAU9I947_9CILI|nr:unnamed protein product [Blepharisma stoltei]
MDLNYLVGNNLRHTQRFEELECTMNSLFAMSSDLFSVMNDLKLSLRNSAEFFMRLKYIHDASQGSNLAENIQIYENNKTLPTRLIVQNKETGNKLYFRIIPGQGSVRKGNILYKCEECQEDTAIKRFDTKRHIFAKHKNLN